MLGTRIHRHRLGVAALGFVLYALVMLVPERRMRQAGGPGIIAFELAGTADRAETMMSRWGPDGQRAARWSLWLDFGYMTTYGTLAALLVDRARRRRGHSIAVLAVVIVAVLADAIEGIALLRVLDRTRIGLNARRARRAALLKFGLLTVGLGYVVLPAAEPKTSQ